MTRRLTLYARSGCHLCSDLIEELEPLLRGREVRLDIVDIDRDPDLRTQYGAMVPVLCAGERELCHYHLNPQAVEEFLNDRTLHAEHP